MRKDVLSSRVDPSRIAEDGESTRDIPGIAEMEDWDYVNRDDCSCGIQWWGRGC